MRFILILTLCGLVAARNDCIRSSEELTNTLYTVAQDALRAGVCSSADMTNRFNRLETLIAGIQRSTNDEIRRFTQTAESSFRQLKATARSLTEELAGVEKMIGESKKWVRFVKTDNGRMPYVYSSSGVIQDSEEFGPYMRTGNLVRSLNAGSSAQEVSSLVDDYRSFEVAKYNNTIVPVRGKRVYRYYWRIPGASKLLWSSPSGTSLRSPSFNIFNYGYRMFLRVHPRQPSSSALSISVGIAAGESDHMLEWPFKFKHIVSLLDRSAWRKDINSKVINPSKTCSAWNWRQPMPGQDNIGCTTLSVSQARLLQNAYIHDDALLLRLSVQLSE